MITTVTEVWTQSPSQSEYCFIQGTALIGPEPPEVHLRNTFLSRRCRKCSFIGFYICVIIVLDIFTAFYSLFRVPSRHVHNGDRGMGTARWPVGRPAARSIPAALWPLWRPVEHLLWDCIGTVPSAAQSARHRLCVRPWPTRRQGQSCWDGRPFFLLRGPNSEIRYTVYLWKYSNYTKSASSKK